MANAKPKQKKTPGKPGKLKFGSPEWRAKWMKKGKKASAHKKQAGKPAGKQKRKSTKR